MGSSVRAKRKACDGAHRARAGGAARGRRSGERPTLSRILEKVVVGLAPPCSLLEKWAVASLMTPEQICKRLGYNPATKRGRRIIARVEELRAQYDDVDANARDLDEPITVIRFVRRGTKKE
jgi:hypothetical protein